MCAVRDTQFSLGILFSPHVGCDLSACFSPHGWTWVSAALSCAAMWTISGRDLDKRRLCHLPATGLTHPSKEQDSRVNSQPPEMWGWMPGGTTVLWDGRAAPSRDRLVGFMCAREGSYGHRRWGGVQEGFQDSPEAPPGPWLPIFPRMTTLLWCPLGRPASIPVTLLTEWLSNSTRVWVHQLSLHLFLHTLTWIISLNPHTMQRRQVPLWCTPQRGGLKARGDS